ncbi:MAG: copper chaperone PCu(A)C [bacterium]|nr:copper chaperone PCu(A)C [bacterium]
MSAAPAGKLSVLDARVRSVPPGVRISAAYMQIANRTDQDDRLTACRYTGAGKVEIHETLVDAEGVMRMRPMQDGLKIPAGAGAALRPGGAHLMLINLNVEPRAGQTIQLECDFAAAGTRSIAARVFEGE